MVRRFVSLENADVHYRIAGEGRPVVLLHDAPGSSARMMPLMSELAQDACAVAIDLPGFGSSSPLDVKSAEVAAFSAALAGTLDALGVVRAPIYGQGFGASIALQLAIDHPERVTAVMVVDTPRADATRLAAALPGPRLDGSHLLAAWDYIRDDHLFPATTGAGERKRSLAGLPAPATLHDEVMDLLRAGPEQLVAVRADMKVARSVDRATISSPLYTFSTAPAPAAIRRIAIRHPGALDADRAPKHASRSTRLQRDYVDTSFGQVLVRRLEHPGPQRPLVLLHSSPGSGAQLVALMRALAQTRTVIALDTLGYGDSDRPPWPEPRIEDYARSVAEVVDKIDIGEEVDLYGTHTGAFIAIETAILLKSRVARVVINGIGVWDGGERRDLIEHYTPPFEPRHDGTHLIQMWAQMRDMTLFWPWYDRSAAGVVSVPQMTASALHEWVVEGLKSGVSYPLGYQATFNYATRRRLPFVAKPVLLLDDPQDVLRNSLPEALQLIPDARRALLPGDVLGRAKLINDYLYQ